ncbi:MAG: hypothetical protein J0I93_02935 [Legionella sp.]|nr:hypothetical protein [Legionella sp.]
MPKNRQTNDIFELKLRHVHKAILSAKNITEVINRLNVTWSSFNKYLQYFIDVETGEATTFYDLKNKWVDEEAGKKHWGALYDTLVTREVNTPKELHFHSIFKLLADPEAGINSRYALSLKLNVSQGRIDNYLARFALNLNEKSVPLNFDTLKENIDNISLFKDALGSHYDEMFMAQNTAVAKNVQKKKKEVTTPSVNNYLFRAENYNTDNLTVRTIHQAILESNSIPEAEKKLNFAANTLNLFLEQFYITENNLKIALSFDKVKHYLPTTEAARKHFQYNYDRPMRPYTISFDERPLYDVHQIILSSNSLADAALRFNMSSEKLEMELNHLGFYSHETLSSFDKIRQITQQDALKIWGLNYYFPIKSLFSGFQLTPRRIHQAILESFDVVTAENNLKIPHGFLELFLNQCNFFDSNARVHVALDFEKMKRYFPTTEHAQNHFGNDYDKIMIPNPVPFSRRTFYEVHRVIVKSNNLAEAATYLDISAADMEEQLNRIGYGYTAIKELWPDILSGMDAWQSAYEYPIAQLQNNSGEEQFAQSAEQAQPQISVNDNILTTYPELVHSHGLFKRKRSQESESDEREAKRRKTNESKHSFEEGASEKESSSSNNKPSSRK